MLIRLDIKKQKPTNYIVFNLEDMTIRFVELNPHYKHFLTIELITHLIELIKNRYTNWEALLESGYKDKYIKNIERWD